MPGASPEIDQELDPFDHPQSTILGIQGSMKPKEINPKGLNGYFLFAVGHQTLLYT